MSKAKINHFSPALHPKIHRYQVSTHLSFTVSNHKRTDHNTRPMGLDTSAYQK